jgi:hypothetical protein
LKENERKDLARMGSTRPGMCKTVVIRCKMMHKKMQIERENWSCQVYGGTNSFLNDGPFSFKKN